LRVRICVLVFLCIRIIRRSIVLTPARYRGVLIVWIALMNALLNISFADTVEDGRNLDGGGKFFYCTVICHINIEEMSVALLCAFGMHRI
jgi:hypothetical protein